MKREDEYRQLANDILQRASEEQGAILRAQWEILSASYMELAGQSKKVEENDAQYDPIPWDRLRRHWVLRVNWSGKATRSSRHARLETCMSDDPKLNEWKLLRDQFDARARESSDIEVIFDAEFRRRFTELINRVIEPQHWRRT
jgi:hypothetical protein